MVDQTQTVLNLENETPLRLHDARKLPWLPGRSGHRLDIGTIHRWVRKGVGGVRLEAVKIGGTTYTTVEAVRRFLQRLNPGTATSAGATTNNQSSRKVQQAEARLNDAGII